MPAPISRLLTFVLLCLPWAGVVAAEVALDSCTDAQGRAVASVEDADLPVVAQALRLDGQAAVHRNPAMLPRLPDQARVFLAARECARIALGHPLERAPTPALARGEDCWALAAMRASGMLPDEIAVTALQAELQLSDADWKAVSGPKRRVDFAACSRRDGALRLPAGGPPTAAQEAHNHCTHACGDRLWQCQQACGGGDCRGGCEQTFDRCEAGCKP
jgi:hypothetical protein